MDIVAKSYYIILFSVAMFFFFKLTGGTHPKSPGIFSHRRHPLVRRDADSSQAIAAAAGRRWSTVETDEATHLENGMEANSQKAYKPYGLRTGEAS